MVEYNKTYNQRRKKIIANGPRSAQFKRKQAQRLPSPTSITEINSLREDIKKLTSNIPLTKEGYTKDKVDEMVNSAIEEVSIDLEKKYVLEIKELKEKELELKEVIDKLNIKLDKRDDVIIDLTTKLSNRPITNAQVEVQDVSEEARPSIDNIFIDPTHKGEEDKFKSYVTNKKVIDSRPEVKANVDKLKKLMGKLPKQK